jgi:hypothetical protein
VRRRGLAAFLAALGLLGLAGAVRAQGLTVSAGAGGLWPQAGLYRDIYGSGTAFGAMAWLKLKGRFGIAAGLDLLSDAGLAEGSGLEDQYPLSFRRVSIPLMAFYEQGAGRLSVRLGAGGSLHFFRERWQTVDLSYRGHEISPRAAAAVSLRILKGLSLFASAAYEPIRAGEDSSLGSRVGIGGFQILGGLLFRVFSR